MLLEAIIDRQLAGQPAVALLRIWDRHGVGPLAAESLDEPLSLAVGSGRVGPGADVPQLEDMASLGQRFVDVCRPVVAHHPAALDPLAVDPGDGTADKADHRRLLFV